jgi:flagellar biosynthesis anti-sigma factor FlgM
MQINPAAASRIAAIGAYSPAGRRPTVTTPSSPAGRGDAVQVSGRAGQARRAHESAAAAPDIRAEKVGPIKAQVQAGTYRVDNHALAERLIDVL